MKSAFRLISSVLMAIASFGTATLLNVQPARADLQPPQFYIPNLSVKERIVLRIASGQNTKIEQINAMYGTRTVQTLSAISGAYIVETTRPGFAQAQVFQMALDPRLEFAEIDAETNKLDAMPRLMGAWGAPSAAKARTQTMATTLGLGMAQKLTTGKGITVAVIDTGVQLDHPDLIESLVPGWDFIGDDAKPEDEKDNIDNNSDGRIDEVYGHGTHIAGIVHLVAPDAKIMPIRILDADGNGSQVNLALGIIYAVERGASIINVSMGSSTNSPFLHSVVRQYRNKGVVIVGAAGNQAKSVMQFPAADACAFGVMSVAVDDSTSSFSNYGDWVDFAAPGEDIYSTFPKSNYAHWSGTSMATPVVSGIFALLKSLNPSVPLTQLTKALSESSVPLKAGSAGERQGLGRIQITSAMKNSAMTAAYAQDGTVTSTPSTSNLFAPFGRSSFSRPKTQGFNYFSTSASYSSPIPSSPFSFSTPSMPSISSTPSVLSSPANILNISKIFASPDSCN